MRAIAVVGLGYVGLPVAVAFARRFPNTLGFDIDSGRVAELAAGRDRTGTVAAADLLSSGLRVSADPLELAGADLYIVAVPTPIDASKRPDLSALRSASRLVGRALSPGDVVVYESTVYPGVTEDICGRILAEESGLRSGVDFKLGYSPERINPGDDEHSFVAIPKVVAAQDPETLEVLVESYGAVVEAGLHRAPSIKVAEAAKVIENTQRDLNIALMNELAIIFDRMGIDTKSVLDAAATKWNFHRYHPGLVGGHCIGVDPYYLTAKAEELGLHPEVILAGRRINDGMASFVATKTIKLLTRAGRGIRDARIAVLGLSFKANVPDIRNSQVPLVVRELADFGARVLVHDPLADPAHARQEYGLELVERSELDLLDAVVLATPHVGLPELATELCGSASVLVDVLGVLDPARLPSTVDYWRL